MTHASLFSGIGGAEIAAAWMGWKNLFHCDINEFGCKVLGYWFPESKGYNDIKTTDFTEWRGKVDVLTAGFPCQPFSLAGKRKGADDDRYLWPETIRVIKEVRPAWFVGENVFGIASMVLPGEEVNLGGAGNLFSERDLYRTEQRYVIDRICEDIEGAGYTVQPCVIPACAVGAPHRRDRVWFVASASSDAKGDGGRGITGGQGGEDAGQDPELDAESCVYGEVLPGASPLTSGEPAQGRGEAHTGGEGGKAGASDACGHSPQGHGNKRARTKDFEERGNGSLTWFSGPGGARREIPRFQGWEGFPNQPPVCRGDDGLPFDVAGLTLPFGRWRKEALKALGNAWVPEVAYEIFRMIQEVENEQD